MSILDYMWAKLVLFGIAAAAWGLFCGLTGRELSGRRLPPASDSPNSQDDLPR